MTWAIGTNSWTDADMPIAVTCQCGSKLEIDEKFLGKEILCPDCQRPLPTTAPATPPPLEIPDHRRVSGLAVLSLLCSLVFWAVGGGIAGIVLGVYALKEIAARPGKLEGGQLARAGIAVGAVGTFVLFALLISPSALIDCLLREVSLASRLDYTVKDIVKFEGTNGDIQVKRPSRAWAQCASSPRQHTGVFADTLILVDTWDDAFIACQDISADDNNQDTWQRLILERLQKSELVNLVGKLRAQAAPELVVVEKKPVVDGRQEIIADMRLAGRDWRFLIHYRTNQLNKVFFFVGCARKGRFERMEKDFRESISEFKAS